MYSVTACENRVVRPASKTIQFILDFRDVAGPGLGVTGFCLGIDRVDKSRVTLPATKTKNPPGCRGRQATFGTLAVRSMPNAFMTASVLGASGYRLH